MTAHAAGPGWWPTGEDWLVGLTAYYLTSLPIVLGIIFGGEFVRHPLATSDRRERVATVDLLIRFDAHHYRSIATKGYTFDPSKASDVAFFPAYPLLAGGLARATGWPIEVALLAVAHVCLLASFVQLHAYARQRYPAEPLAAQAAVAAFGLFPPTIFFRVAYSEPLFFLLTELTLLAVNRSRWHWAAVFAGAASATRPVGIALMPAVAIAVASAAADRRVLIRRLAWVVPLCVWGLVAYMVYQAFTFGDPFAFAQTQTHWRAVPVADFWQKFGSLIILEPVWNIYNPGSPRYWGQLESHDQILFSFIAANPLYFLAATVVIAYGGWKGWLTRPELVAASGLLLIPYVTKGYDNSMLSAGRFAAVVAPAYLIVGRWVAGVPPILIVNLAVLSGTLAAAYAALFGAGYNFF